MTDPAVLPKLRLGVALVAVALYRSADGMIEVARVVAELKERGIDDPEIDEIAGIARSL